MRVGDQGVTAPEGWALVPVNPTEEMYRHMESVMAGRVTRMEVWRLWHAMLRAAPKFIPEQTS